MNIELKTIKNYVEKNLNIHLNTKSRTREEAYARSLYYKIAREYTFFPLDKIGKVVGRDHATVLHGLKLFEEANEYDGAISKVYNSFVKGVVKNEIELDMRKIENMQELIEENEKLRNRVFELNVSLTAQDDVPTYDDSLLIGKLHNLIDSIPENKQDLLYTRLDAIVKML